MILLEKLQWTFSISNISETNIVHGSICVQQQLKYQDLQPYIACQETGYIYIKN